MSVLSSAPLVSVGIPAYNRPAGLKRTLECITRQTYRRLEILISDNCSPDAEVERVARAFGEGDPRVVYHRQPRNLGPEGNFKFLLRQAAGAYFFWAADDDEWTPDFVEVCLANVGDAGSVMTGMRNAVRPRGLLRWKPPVHVSTRRSCYDNLVAFFTNIQPSLIYGIHRTDALRICLNESMMYFAYDYYFILRQILTHGFEVVPQVCFHIGVDSEEPAAKHASSRKGVVYEYGPFLRRSLAAVAASKRLTLGEKARLWFLLVYVAVNEFTHFERPARPLQVKWLSKVQWLMRRAAPWLRLPLPPPPPALVLPDDPAEVCSLFIPHAQLQSEDELRKLIADSQQQLRAKLAVIEGCEAQLAATPAGRQGRPAEGDADAACADLLSAPETHSLALLRDRLGRYLLQLEKKEARIQTLIAQLAKHRSRTAA